RTILPKVRDDVLQHLGIEDSALHVLGAGIFPALQDGDIEARAGHGDGRGDPRGSRAHYDAVEFVIGHSKYLPGDRGNRKGKTLWKDDPFAPLTGLRTTRGSDPDAGL